MNCLSRHPKGGHAISYPNVPGRGEQDGCGSRQLLEETRGLQGGALEDSAHGATRKTMTTTGHFILSFSHYSTYLCLSKGAYISFLFLVAVCVGCQLPKCQSHPN